MTRLAVIRVIPFLLALAAPGAAQDVLIFKNGDHLTGRIMRLIGGEVYFKTPPIRGTLQVGWERIERIESGRRFEVELIDGSRVAGAINTEPRAEELKDSIPLKEGDQETEVPVRDVARMAPILEKIGGQVERKVDFGFNFAKANDQVLYSLNESGS